MSAPPTRCAISSLSREAMNPYLSQLYAALDRTGIPKGPDARLDLGWLLGHRRTVRFLHAHWPESLYRWHRGPRSLRPALAWVKLVLFVVRLRIARLLGYRVVWTIHQVLPHDTTQPALDRSGARALARAASVLLAHDRETAADAARQLGRAARDVRVVAHGSYVGVYPPGRPRAVVREELGVGDEEVVALCFGELRSDSDVDVLVDALAEIALPGLRLVVAGNVKAESAARALDAAAGDPRVVRLAGFVPFEGVAELFDASDLAVQPRGNGGTSGSLILALSMGVPVVVADRPAYREATHGGAAGWLFAPRDAGSLAAALAEAVASPEARREKAAAARAAAAALDWDDTAREIASALVRA